jgi:hypothetical protein
MILIRLKGGLGNQMFQYAAALALSTRLKAFLKIDLTMLEDRDPTLVNMVFREYELAPYRLPQEFATPKEIHRFNPEGKNILQKSKNRASAFFSPRRVYLEPANRYDSDFLKTADDYCLVGSFQSELYFTGIRDSVIESFAYRHAFGDKTEELGAKIRSQSSVCIHVRRGDYVQNPVFSKILGPLEKTYYQNGLSRITSLSRIDEVYVFSDDIDWCRENLNFEMKTTFVSDEIVENDHHVHMYLMRQCKYFVISNSTFSWWAAWLSERKGKHVVGPRCWFADSSRNSSDILPTSWERI